MHDELFHFNLIHAVICSPRTKVETVLKILAFMFYSVKSPKRADNNNSIIAVSTSFSQCSVQSKAHVRYTTFSQMNENANKTIFR